MKIKFLSYLADNLHLIPNITPCTIDEIYSIEQYLGRKLPVAYKEFLSLMGKKPPYPFEAMNYDYIFDLKSSPVLYARYVAIDILKNTFGSKIQLRYDDFVFEEHQGSYFCFFPLGKDENPPVYCFTGESEDFVLEAISFSEYINTRLKNWLNGAASAENEKQQTKKNK